MTVEEMLEQRDRHYQGELRYTMFAVFDAHRIYFRDRQIWGKYAPIHIAGMFALSRRDLMWIKRKALKILRKKH